MLHFTSSGMWRLWNMADSASIIWVLILISVSLTLWVEITVPERSSLVSDCVEDISVHNLSSNACYMGDNIWHTITPRDTKTKNKNTPLGYLAKEINDREKEDSWDTCSAFSGWCINNRWFDIPITVTFQAFHKCVHNLGQKHGSNN